MEDGLTLVEVGEEEKIWTKGVLEGREYLFLVDNREGVIPLGAQMKLLMLSADPGDAALRTYPVAPFAFEIQIENEEGRELKDFGSIDLYLLLPNEYDPRSVEAFGLPDETSLDYSLEVIQLEEPKTFLKITYTDEIQDCAITCKALKEKNRNMDKIITIFLNGKPLSLDFLHEVGFWRLLSIVEGVLILVILITLIVRKHTK